jgi:hypothetical protein
MLAQVYCMRNEFKNVPCEILKNINEMGIDDDLLLTELEGKYFNALYQIDEKNFSLSDKKVAFFTGSLGKTKSSKKKYFVDDKSNFESNNKPNTGMLYIFDEAQKKEANGYDAAIVYWSKRLVPIKEVVKNLKEKR